MPFWSRLFGGAKGEAPAAPGLPPEEHKGFVITPAPIREGGQHRVAARIEKVVGGERKVHELVRADLVADAGEARRISLAKARQMIDEQGDRLFG